MAALLADPSRFLCSPPPTSRRTTNPRPFLHLKKPPPPWPRQVCRSPCRCSARTLAPDPASPPPAENAISKEAGESGGRDRRRAVRIAWEKLVRWSRSWRSRRRSDVLETTKKVVVLGGGSFGTAMAAHVARKKAELEVAMLLRDERVCRSINQSHVNCKYLPEYKLPENIVATTNARDALAGADFCLHAVPVQFILS